MKICERVLFKVKSDNKVHKMLDCAWFGNDEHNFNLADALRVKIGDNITFFGLRNVNANNMYQCLTKGKQYRVEDISYTLKDVPDMPEELPYKATELSTDANLLYI